MFLLFAIKSSCIVLCFLCDGQLSVTTREDIGEAQENKVHYTHRSRGELTACHTESQRKFQAEDQSNGKAVGRASLSLGRKGKVVQGKLSQIG